MSILLASGALAMRRIREQLKDARLGKRMAHMRILRSNRANCQPVECLWFTSSILMKLFMSASRFTPHIRSYLDSISGNSNNPQHLGQGLYGHLINI